MATTNHWGPLLWKLLHHCSYYSKPSLDLLWRQCIFSLPSILPCEDCTYHFTNYLHKTSLWKQPNKLYHWLSKCHSHISKRLHKKKVSNTWYFYMEPFQSISSWEMYHILCILYYTNKENESMQWEYSMYTLIQVCMECDQNVYRQLWIWKPLRMYMRKYSFPIFFETICIMYWKTYFEQSFSLWKQVRWIPFSPTSKQKKQIQWNPMPFIITEKGKTLYALPKHIQTWNLNYKKE
jgi:hypothetical protein